MYEHSEPCAKHTNELIEANKKYEEKFPKFCRNCRAAGWKHFRGTRMDPPGEDACEDCICSGICPVCGTQHENQDAFTDDYPECISCGYSINRKNENVPPAEPECICTNEDWGF